VVTGTTPVPTEIDVADGLVGCNLGRRALEQDCARHQDDDPAREAENEVHIVLDEEDWKIFRQSGEHVEYGRRLALRDAGGGLIEQKDTRAQGNGDGDLDQPLLS
jgi:hypothetical protein